MMAEEEAEEQEPTDYSGVIIGAILVPVYIFVAHFGNSDMALSAFVSLGTIMLAVRIRWELTDRVWFWVVIACDLALHVPVVLMFPWSQIKVNRITLLPIGVAELLIVLGSVQLIEKFIKKAGPSDDEEA